ncbi:MAG TPA: GWxTD domain-containing protein [Vicinamibacteria bacterium]|nr:GWxTD domain-containing protein [Vicinamibacteria bacterium]
MAILLVLPAALTAQKLDEEDKKFLSDVHPIILRDEEATFKGLGDKADRVEFRRLFWARRDPKSLARYAELPAPENDFQRQYLKDLAAADDRFHFAYLRGSSTDCGRILILLGKPDDAYYGSQASLGLQAWASRGVQERSPVTWVYEQRPGLDLGGPSGRLVIRFDEDCKAAGTIAQYLERIAATKIVHREIGYFVGRDGHLVPLAEQLPRETIARRLLNNPRQDFPVAVATSFLRTDDGRTAVLGLVRGEDAGRASGDSAGTRTVDVSVAASALAQGGSEVDRTEQATRALVSPDGAFVGSFKLTLRPGRYTLKAVVLDVDSGRGSVASLPVEVPDLAGVETTVLLLLRDIEETGGDARSDAANPYAAFTLGTTRLVPHFGTTLHRTDPLVIFYQAYNLSTGRDGRADATVTVSVMKGTSTLAARRDAITTSVAGAALGPVPLAALEPGNYLVRLALEDRVSDRHVTQEMPLAIVP